VTNPLVLIQTRITKKQERKLEKAQQKAGVVTRAEFLRQIVSGFLEEQERKEKN
jgi:metal-responsive CopG/Arc/MetJ family transcriptional regulator